MPTKSAKVALALAASVGWAGLFGIGHFYLRHWARGLLWMIAGLLVYDGFWAVFRGGVVKLSAPILILWGLGAFSLWFIHVYDAYRLAKVSSSLTVPTFQLQFQRGVVEPLKDLPIWGLALLFLPVFLTSLACFSGACALWRPFSAFLAYGLANWVTLGFLISLLRRSKGAWEALGWRWPNLKDILPALIAALLGIFVVFPAAQRLNELLGTPMRGMAFQIPDLKTLAVILFYAVVTAPFAEELLFRGYGLGYLLAKGLSPIPAGVLQLLVFGIIHLPYFGIGGMVFILLWGWLPTTLRLWQGHLASAWLMHLMNNAFAYVVVPLWLR